VQHERRYAGAPGALRVGTRLQLHEGEPTIARKPNYAFERQERERLKALKVAEKAEAKRLQRERERGGQAADEPKSDD
jgi:hypothetical protein